MKGRHIDHVNLHIPDDGKADAEAFYGGTLGFGIEDTAYEAGEKSFFDVRVSATSVLHLWPDAGFERPSGANFKHVCVVVEESSEAIEATLREAGVEPDKLSDAPMGATGAAPAVYVTDPFGYQVELKERV
jgi:catechol 2,3-dioxygenase-like lactoylglutathione lyase family enzyme